MKKLIFGLALAAVFAGCATVTLSEKGSMAGGERLLVIQNDGYMLLGTVPLASGRLSWNVNGKSVNRYPALFSNNADTQHLYSMAMKVADRENCDLKDVVFIDNSSLLDFNSCYGLITCDDVAISAVLVPRK